MATGPGVGELETVGKVVVVAGLVVVALGLLLLLLGRLGVSPRPLPGDIVVRRPGLVVYLPVVTMLVLSVLATAVMYILSLLRR